jgi:hypothetical protein
MPFDIAILYVDGKSACVGGPMPNHRVIAAIILLVLVGPAVGLPALAQDPGRGTTLVCINEGGDLPYVVEWTPEQVADYEARTGRDVAEIAVHPATGDCTDVAGVVLGWGPGLPWRCRPDAEGRWSGPDWVYPWERVPNQVPPDPATGGCPRPWSPIDRKRDTPLEWAAATAVHMTELEVAGDYQRLYAWMHPDARAVIPQEAMEGWYRGVFAQRPPVWMTVDDVQLVEWTWEVTGKVYPSAAEVTFRQRFEDGAETEGITHLVRDNGVWRWFFGGSREFVEEQITRYGGTSSNVATSESQGSTGASAGAATSSNQTAIADNAASVAASTLSSYSVTDLGTGIRDWSNAHQINDQSEILRARGRP